MEALSRVQNEGSRLGHRHEDELAHGVTPGRGAGWATQLSATTASEGSGDWADPVTGLSFGSVTNELKLIQAPAGGDRRIFRLGGLALHSARAGSGLGKR